MKLISCNCFQCRACRKRAKGLRFLMKKIMRRKARRIERRNIKSGKEIPKVLPTGYWA